jgi:hypothetical protein
MTTKPPYLLFALILLIGSFGVTFLSATPTIGAVAVTPNSVSVNTPTTLTFTAVINDPLLLPMSVTLLRVTVSGTSVVGYLHDDGLAGDAVGGDHIFTALINLEESDPSQASFQVSAAFSGLLRRVMSPPIAVVIQGLLLPAIVSNTQYAVQGSVAGLNSYYTDSNLFIATDLTFNVVSTIKGGTLPSQIIVQTLGGTVGNESQLPPYGQPFAVGQRIVLLLDGPDSNNKYSIASGSLGIFRLQEDPHGQTVAVIDSGYNHMETAIALDPTYLLFLKQSSQSMLSLGTLITVLSN